MPDRVHELPLGDSLTAFDTDADDEDGLPYGVPEDPDDPRFTARSAMDWGTRPYAIHPEEALGEPTDDDHDWRGPSRYID